MTVWNRNRTTCLAAMMAVLLGCIDHAAGSCSISGVVQDLVNQAPLPGVTVVYSQETQGGVYRKVTTNPQGQFEIDELPEGVAVISARPQPDVRYGGKYYASRERELKLGLGEHLEYFRIVVEEGALISGQVRDISSNPVAGIEIQESSEDGQELEWTHSDSEGYYAMRLPPGRHCLSLDSNGVHPALPRIIDVTSLIDHQSVDFTTYDAGTGVQIRGNIMNPGGAPVHDDTMLLVMASTQSLDTFTIDNFNLFHMVSADYDLALGGSYNVAVPPNMDYHVNFLLINGDSSVVIRDSIPVAAGSPGSVTPNHHFVYDSEGGTISGSVTVNGSPTYSGTVLLTDSAGTFTGLIEQLAADGAYEFHNVPAGNYRVQARHWDYGKSLPVAVNGLTDGGAIQNVDLNIQTESVPTGIKTPGNSTAELTFNTDLEKKYRIESSTDLKNWVTVAMVTGDGASTPWTDQHAAEPAKFYRVLLIK